MGARYLVALFLAPVFVGLFGMLLELCMRRTYGQAIRSMACCSPSARRW
jgi:hypothetical protein